jgi:phospholipid/cholesterol/gamma-HCH transport system ATP-binding protein
VSAVLELSGVVKDYHGLRPLRIAELTVGTADHVAVVGIDQPAAEMMVNLITGAFLPDAGAIRIFGRSTTDIADAAEWLQVVDRFGIVTDRVVLVEPLSVIQNLAMPFSLDIEPPADDLRQKAIALAHDVGLAAATDLDRPVGELDPSARARVRLGRALALEPAMLLLEHPTASMNRPDVAAFGHDVRSAASRRRAATLTMTADLEFAAAAANRILTLDPASGRLAQRRRGWFG